MPTIKKATIKSYSASTHKATVQIAGSLGVWLDNIRVATDIPAADVVAGRQCTVLFLDPTNQDDAVVLTIQGALPSTGAILIATATAALTLTTTPASITGDGDSSKVRLLLPTVGDWQVEATFDFAHTGAGAGTAVGELFVNDSGTPETAQALLAEAALRATVVQRWKVTTTADNTPVELKARKTAAGGTALAQLTHTRLTAVTAGGGGGVTDHGTLTGLGDDDHPQYDTSAEAQAKVDTHAAVIDAHAMLAAANVWAALQTFSAGVKLGEGQPIQDSGGFPRIQISAADPNITMTLDAGQQWVLDTGGGGFFGVYETTDGEGTFPRYIGVGSAGNGEIHFGRILGGVAYNLYFDSLLTRFNGALHIDGDVGFYGTAPAAKGTVTGSRGGNAALASLLTKLAAIGLITDSSTA